MPARRYVRRSARAAAVALPTAIVVIACIACGSEEPTSNPGPTKLQATFEDPQLLVKGNQVFLSAPKRPVGSIDELDVSDQDGIVVTMNIDAGVNLPDQLQARVDSFSASGITDRFIVLESVNVRGSVPVQVAD